MAKKKRQLGKASIAKNDYDGLLAEFVSLLETARHTSARTVNAIMTVTYWQIGRRIVEVDQVGKGRAEYGRQLLERLASDLTKRFGRGFSRANLEYMRRFYERWAIPQTVSGESLRRIPQTPSGESVPLRISEQSIRKSPFTLSWSHYLPSKELLRKKLIEWSCEVEEKDEG